VAADHEAPGPRRGAGPAPPAHGILPALVDALHRQLGVHQVHAALPYDMVVIRPI
jgi:hypothetical protein